MAISLSGSILPRPVIGIRVLIYGGFALLVAIILAASIVSLLAMRDFAQASAELQRLHAASELAAEIDRRMTALRLAARDVFAEGSSDASSALAQANDLVTLLVAAWPQLSYEGQDMIDGINQRLAAYIKGFERLVTLAQSRTEGIFLLDAAATEIETRISPFLLRGGDADGAAAWEAVRTALQLLIVQRRSWLALTGHGAADPAIADNAAEDLNASLSALRATGRANDIVLDGVEHAATNFRDVVASLGRTIGEMRQLDDEVLRSEGRLITRTTELLRQSGARNERNLAAQLSASLDKAFTRSLGLGAAALVIALAAAFFVARRTAGPLEEITQAMHSLAEGGLSTQVPYLDDRTEVGEMARATDVFQRAMIAINEARRRAQQAPERLSRQRDAAEVARAEAQ